MASARPERIAFDAKSREKIIKGAIIPKGE